ncbi:unnamed protein product, partial [Bubo scandiacus]
ENSICSVLSTPMFYNKGSLYLDYLYFQESLSNSTIYVIRQKMLTGSLTIISQYHLLFLLYLRSVQLEKFLTVIPKKMTYIEDNIILMLLHNTYITKQFRCSSGGSKGMDNYKPLHIVEQRGRFYW